MTSPPEAGSNGRTGSLTRLHPAVFGVWALQRIVPLAVVLLFAGLLPGLLSWAGLGLVAVLALILGLRYLRFRWKVGDEAVVIEQGFLFRKRRIIPRERIQSVDLRRGIAHRLMGVVEVRIEAIGGSDTQGKLDAVAPRLAQELRRTLLPGSGTDPGADGSPETAEAPRSPPGALPWARVGPGSLVVAGLTGGRVGVMAALLGFFLQITPEAEWTGFLGRVLGEVPDPTTAAGIRVLALLGLFLLVAAFVLSVAASVAAHWNFTLAALDRSLTVRRGLITEHQDTVPFGRIQAVRVEENLVRRVLGLGAVRAVVAGRAGGAQADPGSGLLLPIGRRDAAFRVALDAVGLERQGIPTMRPMPRRALRRRMARAVGAATLGAAGLATLPLLPGAPLEGMSFWARALAGFGTVLGPGILLARGAYLGLGRADLGSHVVVREGVLNRRTTFVAVSRLQAVQTRESPLQRWRGLATLQLPVARPLMDPIPRALDLDRAEAEEWRETLAGRVGAR